jgi:hypothetical protein
MPAAQPADGASTARKAEGSAASALRHLVPELRLFHGDQSLDALQGELARLGSTRAVIVCGASLARDEATMALLRRALGPRCAGVLPCVRAHSPLDAVQAAAADLRAVPASCWPSRPMRGRSAHSAVPTACCAVRACWRPSCRNS